MENIAGGKECEQKGAFWEKHFVRWLRRLPLTPLRPVHRLYQVAKDIKKCFVIENESPLISFWNPRH